MWQLVFYLSFVMYYGVFGLVIILCLCAVGCLTVVASVFVVLLCSELTTTESMVKIWHL